MYLVGLLECRSSGQPSFPLVFYVFTRFVKGGREDGRTGGREHGSLFLLDSFKGAREHGRTSGKANENDGRSGNQVNC